MFGKKHLNRFMALFVFLISFITYWRTIAPTVSFWDCGEFISCSYILGIPHPPGAPLYLLIGRLVSMIPFVEDIGLRVNVVSALTSALTIMLTYLIIVRLIEMWRGVVKTLEDRVIVYASGVIGALTFAFSDTFWFNAVEAEVYAISMFFTAIVVWLVLIWYEKADEPGSDRYLIIIMYCVGLAIGVHLLNVLALPAIILVVYFRKSEISIVQLLVGVIGAAFTFGIGLVVVNVMLTLIAPVYEAILLPIAQMLFPTLENLGKPGMGAAAVVLFPIYIIVHAILYQRSETWKFYHSCALLVSVTSLILAAIYPSVVKGVPWLMDKGEFSVINPLLILTIALTTLFYLFPRFEFTGSATRKIAGVALAFISVVALIWFFISGDQVWDANIAMGALVVILFGLFAFGMSRWIKTRAMQLALMSFIVILIGCSSYLMIYIRSNLDPPIDENDPETTQAMVSYLNRDQYGQWSITDRKRWKPESVFKYSGEMDYLWNYQIKRMYLRYFAWNFMGKGATYSADNFIKDTFSFRGLWWLPFLLGIIGMIYHFYKDWRQALMVLVLFVITGVGIVIYLNQEDPQPRERDYVYVASFFAFALWVGMGLTAILDKVIEWYQDQESTKLLYMGITIILIAFIIPVNMYAWNFNSHDRTGNYVAFDYSYNILQSCDKDGILFTNGDNDTFPLWFLQNCVKDPETGEMGVRKDVRVVNLSLLNTPWYIKQLKHEEPKVPITLTDAEIEKLQPVMWRPRLVKIDVPKEIYLDDVPDVELRHQLMNSDTLGSQEITFEVAPTIGSREQGGIRVQDQMVLNILLANQWKKPVYFAVTVSRSNQLISRKRPEYSLERYLRMDGLTFKVTGYPAPANAPVGLIKPELIEDRLLNDFQYRGLNDKSVYFNENIMGLLTNYRAGFMRLALHYHENHQYEKMVEIMELMNEKVPQEIVPIDNMYMLIQIGQLYGEAGRNDRYIEYLESARQYGSQSQQQQINVMIKAVEAQMAADSMGLLEQMKDSETK